MSCTPHVAGQIVALIDAELADLAEIRADLNHDAIALSRAQAPERAQVGDDPATLRARKYAESTQRALIRTLGDLRRLRPAAAPAPARRDRPVVGFVFSRPGGAAADHAQINNHSPNVRPEPLDCGLERPQ